MTRVFVVVEYYSVLTSFSLLLLQINKSRGLVPRQHVQEESIQNGDLPFKVDLPGEGTDSNQPPLPSSSPPQQQLDSSASSAGDGDDQHQQQSPPLETAPSSAETPGLASAPPSPINNQPDPGLEESGQFAAASKHSATVIEGTTFYDDDDLLKTATPSPTYSAGAVTKTATVEVNFADNELKEHQHRPVAPVEDVSAAAASKGEASASKEEAAVPASDTEMKGKVLNLLKKSTSLEKGGGNNATNAPQNKSSSSSEESASAAASKADDETAAANASADAVVIKISNQSAASEISESALKVEEGKETDVQHAETPEASVALETVEAAAAQPSESDAPVIVPFVENAVVENDSAVEEEKEHQQAATELEQSKPEEEEKETAESSPVEDAPAKDPQKASEGEAESSLNSLLNEGSVVAPDSNSKLDAPEVPPPVVQSQNLSVETPAAESSPAAENQSPDQQLVDSAAAPAAPVEEVAPPPPLPAETAASSETKVVEEAGIPAVEPVLSDELPAVPSLQQPVVPQQPEQPVVVAVPAGGETVSLPPQMGNGGGEPVVPQGSARPPYHHHHPHHSPPSSFQAEAKMIPHSTEQQQFGEQHQQHLHQPPPPVNSAWRSSAQYQTTLPPPAEEALQAAHQQQQQPQVQQQQTQTHHHQQQQFASHNPHSAHQHQQQPPHHHHQPPPPPLPKLSDLVHPASANQAAPAPAQPAQPSTGDHSAAASFPASDALVDPAVYAEEANTTTITSNSSRRKLLAERVAFVGVIMDIIPDEVELFFENLNVSMHAIVFTSIIAIFWSFTKVLTSFVNSSRKQGELRGECFYLFTVCLRMFYDCLPYQPRRYHLSGAAQDILL